MVYITTTQLNCPYHTLVLAAQVEVQEAYGKQNPQRYPLDPPDPKSVTGEDTSTHNRGMGGPLARLPLSVQPGEVLVQVLLPLHRLL